MSGRSDDIIESGDERISATELERIVMTHPAVSMAACVGVSHPEWGERPVLVIVRRTGRDVRRKDVLALYAGQVLPSHVPDDVLFVEHMPIDADRKVHRSMLRELCADLVQWSEDNKP